MDLITIFDAHPGLFVGTMTVFGLLIGSFLNVVILRLPVMMERAWKSECRALLKIEDTASDTPEPFDLVRPRSRCPQCGGLIAALDNVPVLSYLVLRGRCRHCGAPISLRYPIIEAIAGLAGGYAAWHFGVGGDALTAVQLVRCLAAALLVWSLIALAVIDLDTQLLPDNITLPLLWAGIALGFFGVFTDLRASVLGAIAGYLSLWSIYWAFKLVTGKEGMGYGDFKLLAALGAWMGWQALPAVILISSAVGAIIGLSMMATGLIRRSQPIPFGPYLAAAGMITFFWEHAIVGIFSGSAAL